MWDGDCRQSADLLSLRNSNDRASNPAANPPHSPNAPTRRCARDCRARDRSAFHGAGHLRPGAERPRLRAARDGGNSHALGRNAGADSIRAGYWRRDRRLTTNCRIGIVEFRFGDQQSTVRKSISQSATPNPQYHSGPHSADPLYSPGRHAPARGSPPAPPRFSVVPGPGCFEPSIVSRSPSAPAAPVSCSTSRG
jgi:hypothetical protein